jgi:hypothetical protein
VRTHHTFDDLRPEPGEGRPASLSWERFGASCIDRMAASRKLFRLHQLDRSALEKVHGQDHADQRIDLEERVRKLSSDPGVPARQRWLMATSMAAV